MKVVKKLSETEDKNDESGSVVKNYRKDVVLALRFFQLLTVAMVVVGFIWGAGDFLSALLPDDSPVAPLSLLLMLYGGIGSLVIEILVRVVERKK